MWIIPDTSRYINDTSMIHPDVVVVVIPSYTIYWERSQAAMLRDLSDVIKSQLGVQAPPIHPCFGHPKDYLNLEVLCSSVVSGRYISYPLWRLTHIHVASNRYRKQQKSERIQKWCFDWDEEQCLRSTWWHLCTAINVAEILSYFMDALEFSRDVSK